MYYKLIEAELVVDAAFAPLIVAKKSQFSYMIAEENYLKGYIQKSPHESHRV